MPRPLRYEYEYRTVLATSCPKSGEVRSPKSEHGTFGLKLRVGTRDVQNGLELFWITLGLHTVTQYS
eukprot:scaffold23715_cov43-Prasinocladus_malaysianus.AAC.2